MKRIALYFALVATLVSCSEKIERVEKDSQDGVSATAVDFIFDGATTKTTITQQGSTAPQFAWKEGDVIGVIPMDNKTVQSNYEIAQIGSDPRTASFDGGVWALKEGKEYAAYYPFQKVAVVSGESLSLYFDDQTQDGNNSLAHLGDYDYMYASTVSPADGYAHFEFKHLVSLIRLQLRVPAGTYSNVRLASETHWFGSGCSLALSTGEMTATGLSTNAYLALSNITFTTDSTLVVWMSVPPTDVLEGKSLEVTVYSTDGRFSGTITNVNSFKAGKAYSYNVTLTAEPQGDFIPIDLSDAGTANCYVVTKAGNYKFCARVKGGSNDSVGNIASAEVLWESYGTDTAPSIGDLIHGVTYKDGYISFTATSAKGNAVIAVKDSVGTILWSWHIWMTDKPADQQYKNNAGIMMDRNLGATSVTPGEVQALGLLYQNGRKDPFLAESIINSPTTTHIQAESTSEWPEAVMSNANTGTIEYGINNPMTFIKGNSYNNYWLYTGSESIGSPIWSDHSQEKSIYDPCPGGYRIPMSSLWETAFGISIKPSWDNTNRGWDFAGINEDSSIQSIWYPIAGFRYGDTGAIGGTGYQGGVWSCSGGYTSSGWRYYGLYLCTPPKGEIGVSNGSYPSTAKSVRCQKE